MNQVAKGVFLKNGLSRQSGLSPVPIDPVGAAAVAIERCLAQAHEAGDADAVRLLHAVSAILSAPPRA
jgi:hypothetical protein